MMLLVSCGVVHGFISLVVQMSLSGELTLIPATIAYPAWTVLSFPLFMLLPPDVISWNFWLVFGANSVVWGFMCVGLMKLLNPH